MHVLKIDQTTYHFETRQEGIDLGLSETDVDAAIDKGRLDIIKRECGRRIYTVASAETQMNMTAAAAVVSGKTSGSRSDPEKDILSGFEQALGWIGAMRANVVALHTDPTKDPLADENWPDVSAEVQALANTF